MLFVLTFGELVRANMGPAREEMFKRSIRILNENIGFKPEIPLEFLSGNAILLESNLALTNKHICESIEEREELGVVAKLYTFDGLKIAIEKMIKSDSTDLCLVITNTPIVKNFKRLKILKQDSSVLEPLIGVAYSRVNIFGHTEEGKYKPGPYLLMERRAEVSEVSNYNENTIKTQSLDETDEFKNPIYILTMIVFYGDSGGAVYKTVNEKPYLAGIVFSKIGNKETLGYAGVIPASTIRKFLKESKIKGY